MATYLIKSPYHTRIMKRVDAAVRAYRNMVYEALAAGGQLDTHAGHSIHKTSEQYASEVASGAYTLFSLSLNLPHNAGIILFERNS